jgi:hypothetical protein
VAAAQAGSLPLGSTLYLYRRLLDQPVGDPVARIAFDLQLPIIENIPTAALVRIRQDEHEYFKRFQFRLRQAIEERRRLGSGAEAIAKEIETDLIEPELQRLRDRLVASERALSKKAAVGMALGALATTCGVLSGLPLPVALGAGVGTVVTMTGTAASKHIEEERDASLEDLYFLWKAVQHVHQ